MPVKSPKIQWKKLTNFDLSKLKETFQIADFERKQNNKHVDEIVDAILQNKFYDIVVRVVKSGERLIIIDSQHRLQALYIVFKFHGVTHYDLMLAIYEKKDARTIYRRLNLGKRLVPKDHTLPLDDGVFPIFQELKGYATHVKNNTTVSFVNVFDAINYLKNNEFRAMSPVNYDDFLLTITPKDTRVMKLCLETLRRFNRGTSSTIFYSALVFRNIIKIAYEKNLSGSEIYDLVEKLQKDDQLLALSTERKLNLLPKAYELMEELL